ncbi:EamA family transporter [Corallococcus praedator]|uniref:EamA family transporter n=1 Tax=Corallococcus praedator TaxID=2316724 RepID=A0ABX9QKS6_9BACT|nr:MULTISPECIES: EamA family transporter [Corallococcus]RKH15747.1 EamA family transporter [Corallococcus sp. CA047B]RKH30003.1 EamA family transporter [Corallococcus sp. CA031C]RKI09346.1 EamA family transporter [Corallococcus praedator]
MSSVTAVSTAAKSAPRWKIAVAYAICFLTWGSTWAVVKVGLEDLPPLRFVGTRMLIAGVALLPFARSRGATLGGGTGWRIAGIGVLQLAVPFGLLFVAQQWIPSSWSALLFSTFPVWLLLVGRVLLPDQPLTPQKLFAAVLGLTGVVALQHQELVSLSLSAQVLLGCGMTLGAASVVAVANVLVRQHMTHVPPHLLTLVQTLSSAVLLLGASALLEWNQPAHWTPRALGALLYLALGGTVITYQCLYWLLPRISLAALGAMALLDTLVAVTLGVALLGEPLTPSLLAGGVLILTAAAIANREPPEAKVPPEASA